MTRGQCGSLHLHCKRLALSTPCRSSRRTENVDVGKLRELLVNLGHDNVPADEIPAKLDESLKALREQGEKQPAPSNAGADIDATIAAARARLRENDPQGALALLKAKRAEETQARVKRETALLAEQAAVERLAYDYAGAKATLEELLQLDPDAVWYWIDLGDLWRTTGNLAVASRAFHTALDAARRLGRARDEALALERLGGVLVQQGKLIDALKSYQAQLAIVERLAKADPDNTQWQYDLGISNERVGDALLAQGDLAGAMKSYRTRHEIISHLAKADPDNAGWQRDLAVSHNKIGDVLTKQDKLTDALQSFRDGLAIIEHLALADPDNTQWQYDLGVSDERIGDVLLAQGDLAGAMKSYRARHEIISHLAKADPDNAGWQRALSVSSNKIGNVLTKQDKLTDALQSFRDGLAIIEHLALAAPDNADWQRDLAISNERIGDVLTRQNDAKGAIDALERALGAYRKLLESNPDDVQARLFSVVPHWRLAGLDKAKAREHLEAALAILEPMAEHDRLDVNRRGWISKIKAQLAALDAPA